MAVQEKKGNLFYGVNDDSWLLVDCTFLLRLPFSRTQVGYLVSPINSNLPSIYVLSAQVNFLHMFCGYSFFIARQNRKISGSE
jgi:hypothetical protein